MIHNLHKFFSKNYTPVGHGVKAAELQGDYPVRDPGQVQQPEGEGLATQVGEDCKLPPRTLHKQDPQARTGGQQHELPGPDGEDSHNLKQEQIPATLKFL